MLSGLENVTITSVENGAQALKEAGTGEYSLLISDIEMPVMSGIQLLRVLRSQFFSGTELPIIMLTQLDHAEQKARAFADGANDYVTKPVEKQELIARARAQIELRELHRKNLTNQALELNAQKLSAVAQLSATLAHELNTPAQFLGDNLAFLSNAIAQLTQYLDAQPNAQLPAELSSLRKEIPSCVRDMEEGLVRIAKLVQTISEFADAKSQRLGQVDLERSIEATVELLRSRWLGLVDITMHHGPQVGQLIGWPHELKHALWQLITQAIDYATAVSSGKGRVHIATSVEDETLVISVRAQSGSEQLASMPPSSKETLRMLRAVLNQHGAELSCDQTEDGALISIIRLTV
jgi:CheY-like chemotaxis protein